MQRRACAVVVLLIAGCAWSPPAAPPLPPTHAQAAAAGYQVPFHVFGWAASFLLTGTQRPPPAGTPWETDFVPDGIYRIRQPLFLVRFPRAYQRGPLPPFGLLAPAKDRDEFLPPSIEQFQREGRRKWTSVLAICPAGTAMQFKELRLLENFENGVSGHPLVVLLDHEPPVNDFVDLRDLCSFIESER